MRSMNHSMARQHGAGAGMRGVSLIEVLVALLIVSFGVLAMAGLLSAATRYGKTSEYRAVGTLLASDIVDRLRANQLAVNVAAGGNVAAYDITGEWQFPAVLPVAAPCVDCTSAQLAAMDKAEWQRAVYYALPNGTGYFAYNDVEHAADVWIAWLDPGASSDETKFGSDDADADRQECPVGFRDQKPQPRCLYFRVGL
jgi:type IV pilus assembly protein PilV